MVHPKPSQLEPILFISILARFTTLAVKIYIYICIRIPLECKLISHLYFKNLTILKIYQTTPKTEKHHKQGHHCRFVSFVLPTEDAQRHISYFFRFDYVSKCWCSQIHFLRENCFSPNFRVSFRASYGFPLFNEGSHQGSSFFRFLFLTGFGSVTLRFLSSASSM